MKCLKCGTTLNVNFEGMCKKCYEDSIEIIEREEQEIERDKNILNINRFFKEKHIIIEAILLVVVLILIIVCIMINSNKKEVEKEYKNLSSKYETLKSNLEDKNTELESVKEKNKKLSKEEKQKELEDKVSTLESNISNLTTQKQSLQSQIDSINGEVIKIKGQPKTYPAGHLVAGTDVPIGKYKIYDGNSNFVVHSSYGDLEVNIILGGRYGINEYIYTFKTGDKIEANSSFKLVEVQ